MNLFTDKTQVNDSFEKVNAYYKQKYDQPIFTENEFEEPVFNTFKSHHSSAESVEKKNILRFSEWLLDSDGYYVDIVVFLHEPYDNHFLIHAVYSIVEYATVREYTNTLTPEQQSFLDDNI